eukprot:TRINITY_DN1958_c0_g1_i1.p1 TRINITY_DN1958_c0_g1~~TRINITY_DN1958_c0_g1_i1.p1  ORF type:complete len:143 (+),score=42.53 TRINITY_DN1958_c0_g1_i1:88-516(+)
MAAPKVDRTLEYKEVFAYFDRDKDGKLSAKEFGDAVRSLGLAPTEADLEKLTAGGNLNYDALVKVATSGQFEPLQSFEIRDKLKVFDTNGTGIIPLAEFQNAMTILGEKLTPEEFAKLTKDAGATASGLNIQQFLEFMSKEK